ncbi:MAG TPA: DNA polymerase III subunit chi [Gammaproteobacteria bacterium]|jgi:DNA polymerase-3 subunit chi|nr:DNA polymerase III subunit chi [Gammaproteobacteria bacterium]
MTQIDFYVLSNRPRLQFICQLAEKVFGLGHRIFIHTESEHEARALDDLMWVFRDRSFLPHCLAGADPDAAIQIGRGEEPAGEFQVLVNLAPQVPSFFSRFERVAEVVDKDQQVRTLGRERFRFYKDRGYPLETHSL